MEKDLFLGRASEGVNFVECQFMDMQGNIRQVSLTIEQLKSTGTTSVDGSSVFGKIIPPTESDMVLVPDFSTFCHIPWRLGSARVICDIYYPPKKEGLPLKPFEGCPRGVLRRLIKIMNRSLKKDVQRFYRAEIKEIKALFAPEVEVLLVPEEYDYSKIHLDPDIKNDHYFVPLKEKADKALKEMLQFLGEMGLKKEKVHTEVASFQYEIGIGYGDIMSIADGTMTIKYVISEIARKHGFRASFIPKFNKNVNGSGMHVHQNLIAVIDRAGKDKLTREKKNIFFDKKRKNGLSSFGENYIAGLLKYAREITAITNPLPISYKRLVPDAEAPTYVYFDWLNRTALARGHSEGTNKVRVEYRAPDPTCNPYLAFAAMLAAGLSGINEGLRLKSCRHKRNLYKDHEGVENLPGNLGEALMLMNGSKMLRASLGDFIINSLYRLGSAEWRSACSEITTEDIKKYF